MAHGKHQRASGQGCLEESLCPALGRIAGLGTDGLAGAEGGGAAFRSAPVGRDPRGSAFPLPDALCPRRLGIEQVERPGRTGDRRRSGVSSRRAAAIWASAAVREWPRKTASAFCPSGESPRRKGLPASAGRSDSTLAAHRIWQGIEAPRFFAWWPSQFEAGAPGTRVLAAYEEAMPDAFSSDIPVADGRVIGWPGLEKRYGILLDPARLHGEPAVMEGSFGRGRVVLSLIHFDTPGDSNGAAVLRNLWDDLAPGWSADSPVNRETFAKPSPSGAPAGAS